MLILKIQSIYLKCIKKSGLNQLVLWWLQKKNQKDEKKENRLTKEEACAMEEMLNDYSKDPAHSAILQRDVNWNHQENESDNHRDLAIVVPVYKVERYIRTCMESLLHQKTTYSYEIIMVNDGTPDGSIEQIRDLLDDQRVHYIQQENKGFSGARNAGLKEVQADYITFVDSDDYVPEHMVESLMKAVETTGADVAQGSYDIVDERNATKSSVEYETAPCKEKYQLPGYPWGKIFRAALWTNIQFPEGYWYEDSIVGHLLLPMAKDVVTISDKVYCYRDHAQGISRKSVHDKKALDSFWITRQMLLDRKRLEIENDEVYVSFLLEQIGRNAQRMPMAPREVKIGVFQLTRELLLEYFPKADVSTNSWKEVLYRALHRGDWKSCEKICRYWSL